MTASFGPRARHAMTALSQGGDLLRETVHVCRVDGATCEDSAMLTELSDLAEIAAADGFGQLEVFGEIQGQIDLQAISVEELAGERLSIRLTKPPLSDWCYFLTEEGFAEALEEDVFTGEPREVWIAAVFAPFASSSLSVSSWDGVRRSATPEALLEQPRKLVRDLSQGRVPADLSPWYIVTKPWKPSATFSAWRQAAMRRLAYVLPTEIGRVGQDEHVVIKGLRTVTAPISIVPPEWDETAFPVLSRAVEWVYATQRDAESKFLFLNNHLALDWRDGESWPEGLARCLDASLASAREAYAFHLQDKSKDALKTLGDLRKSLQEEVGRAQSATRDLLSGFWRDFAIAGAVLALRSPTAASITNAEVLRWVTLGAALLLIVSLVVTIGANWRFNAIADGSRQDWRRKLYAFVSDDEWSKLVDAPISKGRWVYRLALPVVGALYLAAAYYLISAAAPAFTNSIIARLWLIVAALTNFGWRSGLMR